MARKGLPLLPEGARITAELDTPVLKLYRVVERLVEQNEGRPVAFAAICDAWDATPGYTTGAVNAWKSAKRPGWEPDAKWTPSMMRSAVEWRVGELITESTISTGVSLPGTPRKQINGPIKGLLVATKADGSAAGGATSRSARFYAPKPGITPWIEVAAEVSTSGNYRTPYRKGLVAEVAAASQAVADARREIRLAAQTGKRPPASRMWELLQAIAGSP